MSNQRQSMRGGARGARAGLLALVIAMLALGPGTARGDDWHAAGWRCRATVRIDQAGSEGVDTAAVRIHHAGLAQADGDDYRVFDAAGRPVAYQIDYHHPRRDTLIRFRARFRAEPADRTFTIYFGNDQAGADPHRAIVDERPGGGPPRPGEKADGWVPRAGLVLITMRRPEDTPNPGTVAELAALIDASPGLDGAEYVRNISLGVNPFGDSDFFISVHRGWIDLPRAGAYGFCTASNEASFSFIDGRELVHWPGRHTEKRGELGQKNAEHDLAAGLHHVSYFHEEVLLYQVAFLGWKPPGKDRYWAIPDKHWSRPHRAVVLGYEAIGDRRHAHPGGTVITGRTPAMPEATLVDSVWPDRARREAGQYTRYRFGLHGENVGQFKGWQFAWDFGDGLSGRGAQVEHVYLATGDYTLTLTAAGPDGQLSRTSWPITVYPVEHLAGRYRKGSYEAHHSIIADYDPSKLATVELMIELARFFDEAGDGQRSRRVAKAALEQDIEDAALQAAAHLLAAGDAGKASRRWAGAIDADAARAAAAHLARARQLEPRAADRMAITARLIRHLGTQRDDPDAARGLYQQAEAEVRDRTADRGLMAAFAAATVAMGDVHLVAGELERADADYRVAEALAVPRIPPPVRVAKIGAYPERLGQLLEAGKADEAEQVVGEWLSDFPADQVRGLPLMWQGKVALARGAPAEAIGPLRLAVELGQASVFEGQARWLLAEAYRQAGRADAADATLHALAAAHLGPWSRRAAEALQN